MPLPALRENQADRWQHLPPYLQNGDSLSLVEFKRLYENSPDIRAELIEGIVHVASPVYNAHAKAELLVHAWLAYYQDVTPGTEATGEHSVELDSDNQVQPDGLLYIEGAVKIVDGLIVGAPTLVVEVAASTRSYDLGVKRRIYRRNKVQEYLVFAAHERAIFWYSLEAGNYIPIEADTQGIYHSRVFPGLWLDSKAFWQRKLRALYQTVDRGVQTEAHAAFVAKIAAAGDAG